MSYKNKLIVLLSLIGTMALLYAGSFIFTSERYNRRSASYVWLDQKFSSSVNRIVINTHDKNIEFVNRNQKWVIIYDGAEYPARELRIEDFISIFTQNGQWPVRSTSASTHASFGLESGEADRITFYGGSSILLDVLIGYDSVLGNEISIRKFAQNEVRSGDGRIRTYVSSPVQSWYDLKLFPEAETVQQLTVIKDDGEIQNFHLNNGKWSIANTANPDSPIIESYIRTLLSTEGDDFAGLLSAGFDSFSASGGAVTVQYGDGNIVSARFSEPDESGNIFAVVFGKEYIYSIPAWQAHRVFRDTSSFETQ